MKKRLPILLAALALGLAAWKILHRPEFLYAATVEATEVDLSSRVTAVIEAVNVREGDAVTEQQVLVNLSGQDLVLAAENASRDFQRAVGLHKSGSMSDEAFDKIRFRRDDTALRMQWLTIVSPLNGTVLNRYHEPGEMVAPGTKLLTLADLKNLWAYIYIPQKELARVKLDQSIDVVLPDLDMKKMTGRVAHISDRAEFTPKNVQTREERTRLVYAVKIAFDNTGGVLKPGMTVEARLPH